MNYEVSEIESFFTITLGFLSEMMKNEDLKNEIVLLCSDIEGLIFFRKSVSYVIYDSYGHNNCIIVTVDILDKEKKIGYYSLYLDEDKSIIDEFFVLH